MPDGIRRVMIFAIWREYRHDGEKERRYKFFRRSKENKRRARAKYRNNCHPHNPNVGC